MDIIGEYQASNPLSESVLLEDIDEYEIYKFYLGFYPELRTGYNSPLRKGDESPSFYLELLTKIEEWIDDNEEDFGDAEASEWYVDSLDLIYFIRDLLT